MCGVYYIDKDTLNLFALAASERDSSLSDLSVGRDIHPSDTAPVLTLGRNGAKLTGMRWGIPAGAPGRSIIFNARAESVREKRLFSRGIEYNRAVVPADHFYEWNRLREKNVYRRLDGKPLCLAGFYDFWENEPRFVILTTQANNSMSPVHDRMPLVLEGIQVEKWLNAPGKLEEILHQTPVELSRESEYEQLSLF